MQKILCACGFEAVAISNKRLKKYHNAYAMFRLSAIRCALFATLLSKDLKQTLKNHQTQGHMRILKCIASLSFIVLLRASILPAHLLSSILAADLTELAISVCGTMIKILFTLPRKVHLHTPILPDHLINPSY